MARDVLAVAGAWRRAKNFESCTIHLHGPPVQVIHGGHSLLFAMSSWIPESHRLQLAVTALASGCLAASAVIGLQNAKRWYSIHDLKGSIPDLASKHDVEKVSS